MVRSSGACGKSEVELPGYVAGMLPYRIICPATSVIRTTRFGLTYLALYPDRCGMREHIHFPVQTSVDETSYIWSSLSLVPCYDLHSSP